MTVDLMSFKIVSMMPISMRGFLKPIGKTVAEALYY